MPVFTYVASIIVAEVIGIAGAAILGSAGVAFVTSAIALGLATVTSRLINGSGGGSGGTNQNPGVRIQFPPATNNKIPIVYGSANTKGLITDARLSNENKTMTYVLVISEKTATGIFSIGDIFWNDQKLVFGTGANSHIVESSIDQNGFGTTSTNFNGLCRFRVYSGSTNSYDQIFPTQASGDTENARTLLGETDTNYQLNDLVFAVIQVDFSSEKGTTGLGQITFQVNNTLNNPGDVWYDYVTNSRYGAGFTATSVNTVTSIGSTSTSLKSLSNTIPTNQFEADGTTPSTQVRYQINGVLSTGDVVKNNIDKICMSAACWTTYDFMEGKWKVILNREATADELTNAFQFNDDNIIGDITVNATSLEDLYNSLQVEFASRKIRDQNDYYNAIIDPAERNDLEPDNGLNLRLEMSNNAIHAGRVGLIELKQSRVDLIISFTAYHVALGVQAGDVVKITNDIFDFEEKLFRVTKTRELEGSDGSITIEITALEYNADIYTDEELLDSAESTGNGIASFANSLPTPTAPYWDTTPNTTSTHSVDIFDGAVTPYFILHSNIAAGSLPVDSLEFFISTNSATIGTSLVSMNGTYNSGDDVASSNISGVAAGTYYFQCRTGIGNRHSAYSTSSIALVWDPQPGRDQGVI
jgi:hypothetical protein